jgi:hypothetical protein
VIARPGAGAAAFPVAVSEKFHLLLKLLVNALEEFVVLTHGGQALQVRKLM